MASDDIIQEDLLMASDDADAWGLLDRPMTRPRRIQRKRRAAVRRYPITPRNSTVLGYDARSEQWRDWWAEAKWDDAVPVRTRSGETVVDAPCLNVPVPDSYDPSPIADRARYRVRPKREGRGRAVLDGVWWWEYHG